MPTGQPRGGGRIRQADLEEVKDRARLEDVVSRYVTLRRSGASLVSLCPFHDESTGSFHVTPARQLWHCFGCQRGGDVIDFLQEVEGFGFTDAVEHLADLVGITLTYEGETAEQSSRRLRMLAAHHDAWAFFRENLTAPHALPARQFLAARQFDKAACEHFGVGYAPAGWTALHTHLRTKYSEEDLVTAGLLMRSENKGTTYDLFRDRIIWPIQTAGGDVVGFGGRSIGGSDPRKYINTPETPLYRKSEVLYGLNHARPAIAEHRKVVVVEGYTDVMAAHLAGETTAVATCGTALTDRHVSTLRRFLFDDTHHPAQVIFMFDSDAAGTKAATRAYNSSDSRFSAATFIATDPDHRDPCDVRLQSGDTALQEVINAARPLAEWVLDSALDQIDLTTTLGIQTAIDTAAPILAAMRHAAVRDASITTTARRLGLADPRTLTAAVQALSQQTAHHNRAATPPPNTLATQPYLREREALKALLADSELAFRAHDYFGALDVFADPDHAAIYSAIRTVCTDGEIVDDLPRKIVAHLRSSPLGSLVSALAVEPLHADLTASPTYPLAVLTAVRTQAIDRHLQAARTDLVTAEPDEAERLFAQIDHWEQQRRDQLK